MGKRILVVNDTEEILQIFWDILTPEGYDVVLYSYAINDMDEVQRLKPDLVILDLIFGHEKAKGRRRDFRRSLDGYATPGI